MKKHFDEMIAKIKKLQTKEVLVWLWRKIINMKYYQWGQALLGLIILSCPLINSVYANVSSEKSFLLHSDNKIIQVYQTSESRFLEFPETKQVNTSQKQGPSFLYSKATEGAIGVSYQEFELKYDLFGNLIDKTAISDVIVQEAQDVEYQRGSKVKVGAYFYPVYSRFGVDCVGCSGRKTGVGNFASGIHYEKDKGVRQYDGSYTKGITYEGYYIIAADKSIPFCTVLEIENHRFEGAGIKNNVPFQVIVLDRGGAINGNRIDLFIGLESNMQIGYGKWLTSKKTKITIIKRGKWQKNSKGQYACKL